MTRALRLSRVTILAFACGVLATPHAGAVALPPQLVARLEADRAAADRSLARARAQVARAALAQRAASAEQQQLARRQAILEQVAGLVDMRLPRALAEPLELEVADLEAASSAAQVALEARTEAAAQAQVLVIDADRRMRALQRASATEDQRDTKLGSWRFGSGGPSVSAQSIDDYLASKGSPLAGQGAAFLESGVEHELDPRLVVAIAGAESYFGITTCAPHNAWGWGCPNSPFRFRSWAEGIETVTVGLREGYVDDDLTSVGEIHLRYAPPNATNDPTNLNYAWADNVARFLVEQGADPQDIEGVLGPSR